MRSIPIMPIRPMVDAFAFSSLLVAAIGFGLSGVASLALRAPHPLHWALLTGAGAFIVYNLDRLRDTHRDRRTSPERTDFIEHHRDALTYSVAIVAVAFGGLLFAAPNAIAWTCVGVGLIGLFHRRIKNAAIPKALYVSVAWSVACVGLPWIAAQRPYAGLWVAAMILPVLCSNLIASNLRDAETWIFFGRSGLGLRFAGALSLLALGLAILAPARVAPVAWIAAAEGVALLRFRNSERYGSLAIDGALLFGSMAAAMQIALRD